MMVINSDTFKFKRLFCNQSLKFIFFIPSFTEKIIKKTSPSNIGPTNISNVHEFTDWNKVELFCKTIINKE